MASEWYSSWAAWNRSVRLLAHSVRAWATCIGGSQTGAAVSVGISGIFMETHPNPKVALSDGPNAVPLEMMESLISQLRQIDELVKKMDLLEEKITAF